MRFKWLSILSRVALPLCMLLAYLLFQGHPHGFQKAICVAIYVAGAAFVWISMRIDKRR